MYFVHIVSYNGQTQACNKSIESFSTQDGAVTRFYGAMKDISSNTNVLWGNAIISNQYGTIDPKYNTYFERRTEPEAE